MGRGSGQENYRALARAGGARFFVRELAKIRSGGDAEVIKALISLERLADHARGLGLDWSEDDQGLLLAAVQADLRDRAGNLSTQELWEETKRLIASRAATILAPRCLADSNQQLYRLTQGRLPPQASGPSRQSRRARRRWRGPELADWQAFASENWSQLMYGAGSKPSRHFTDWFCERLGYDFEEPHDPWWLHGGRRGPTSMEGIEPLIPVIFRVP